MYKILLKRVNFDIIELTSLWLRSGATTTLAAVTGTCPRMDIALVVDIAQVVVATVAPTAAVAPAVAAAPAVAVAVAVAGAVAPASADTLKP